MTGPRDLARTGGRGRIPTPLRDRRPALAALALLLIVAGALGSALVVYRSGHRVNVLVAAVDIAPGHKMTSSDFTTARVASDTGGYVIPESLESQYGSGSSYAVTRIPKGTLVNRFMFKSQSVMPDGGAIVGMTLAVNQRPAQALAEGDVVEVVYVPKNTTSGGNQAGSNVLVAAARVAATASGSSNSLSGSNTQTVSLLVQTSAVGTVVPAAASDSIALVLLPPGTKPLIDFVS